MLRLTVIAALMLVGVASAQVPHLGSASDAVWSKSDELSIGRRAYDRLYKSGDIYESQADLDYLNYLGNKVASHAQTRLGLTFYLTRSPTINAFATPGGYVGVNIGLVLATENEHELAGVLAHESAHVSQEHIARSVLAAKNRRVSNAAAMVAGILLAAKGGGEVGAASITAIAAGETQNKIDDIRRHEVEADRVGRRLMTQAGFNELGMQSFFAKLYTPRTLNAAPSYLLTHPLPQRRQADIDTLKQRAKKLHSRDEYYLFRARIRAEFLPDAEVSRLIASARTAKKPQIRDEGRYLAALQAMKFGNIDNALSELNRLTTSMRNNRDVLLMRAKLQLLKGQNAKALGIYQDLWKRYQGDGVIAYDYAQYLEQQGQLAQAAAVLSKPVDNALNPQLYWLYGEILGKLGRTAEQQRVLIQYYRGNGDYQQALTQAKIAAKDNSLDWQARAGFEAQVKTLERIIEVQEAME